MVKTMLIDLAAQGHTVFLITTKPPRTEKSIEKKFKIYYLNSRYYNLAKIPWFFRFFWHLSNLSAFKKGRLIKKILIQEKPDLVITHNLMGLGLNLPWIIKKAKIRQEHFLHDVQLLHPSGLMMFGREKKINTWFARVYQIINCFYFSSVAKVISPSRWLLDEHLKRGFFKNSEKEIRPLKQLKGLPIQKALKPGANNFLFVGQIETHKGIFLLLDAFKKLAKAEVTLTIVGDGQKLLAAKKMAASDERIKFLGRLSSEETKKIMLASDYLIVPSLCYENSPTIIYEARILGLPVLASNLGGIPEIIGPNDYLFAPGDERDLMEKIEKLSQ